MQLHEIRETEEGFRAHVRIQHLPPEAPRAQQDAARGKEGWLTAAHKDGRKRLARRHWKIENNERRRQQELWGRRAAADLKSKEDKVRVGESYAHELSECPRGIAFAYGGLYPGTLHAHGALVRTHQVSCALGV